MSLIGWSLGGVYARELARRFPSDVRQVITLASPFRDLEAHNVPAFLLARRRPHPDESAFREQLRAPLPVPTTAIVSRTDGITPWQSCVAEPGPCSESLEVESSHVGMTHHPVVLLTIADRLAQPKGAWRPFRPPGGRAGRSCRASSARARARRLHPRAELPDLRERGVTRTGALCRALLGAPAETGLNQSVPATSIYSRSGGASSDAGRQLRR